MRRFRRVFLGAAEVAASVSESGRRVTTRSRSRLPEGETLGWATRLRSQLRVGEGREGGHSLTLAATGRGGEIR